MALADHPLTWFLTGGASNTNPNSSRGGTRSTVVGGRMHQTFTAGPTEYSGSATASESVETQNQFVDSARIGDGAGVHIDKWVVWVTGGNRFAYDRVTAFDSATGRFTLQARLNTAAISGDRYRLFAPNNMWDDLLAVECGEGYTDHRGIFIVNEGGETLSDNRIYFVDIDQGGTLHRLCADDDDQTSPGSIPSFSPEEAEPDISGFGFVPRYSSPRSYILDQPLVNTPADRDIAATRGRGMFLKRSIEPGTFRKPRAVIGLVAEGRDAGAAQVRALLIMPFDIDGFTPSVTVEPDRGQAVQPGDPGGTDARVPLHGGVTLRGTIKVLETGAVVPDIPVTWIKQSGQGTLVTEDALPRTDEDGETQAAFTAPTDPGQIGQTAVVRLRI